MGNESWACYNAANSLHWFFLAKKGFFEGPHHPGPFCYAYEYAVQNVMTQIRVRLNIIIYFKSYKVFYTFIFMQVEMPKDI